MKEKRTEQLLIKLTPAQKDFLEELMKEQGHTKMQKVVYQLIDTARVFKK